MNLYDILRSPLITRIGWTLLHSLWEGTAIATLLALALFTLRKRAPQSRYIASCFAMFSFAICPVVTFIILQPVMPSLPTVSARSATAEGAGTGFTSQTDLPTAPSEPSRRARPRIAPSERSDIPVAATSVVPKAINHASSNREFPHNLLPWLVLAWAVGVVLLSLWNLGGWLALHHLKTRRTRNANDELIQKVERLCRRLNLSRVVRVLESSLVRCPMVIGAFKPVILLPASILCELPASQLESILAHELAHIRRHDYLVNLFQSVIETLLFYHPATWWISRRIRIERENCCDDIALSLTSDRAEYVRALAAVASARLPALAPAASGGMLLARVKRVLGIPEADTARSSKWIAGAAALLICAVTVLTFILPVAGHAQQQNSVPATQPAKSRFLDLLVIDKESRQPVLNVSLSWYRGGKNVSGRTDAQGRARVEFDSDAKALLVEARAPAYVPAHLSFGGLTGPLLISDRFTLPIEHGTTIGGHVVDEQGKRIVGANVELRAVQTQPDDPKSPIRYLLLNESARTDDQGLWACDIAPPGRIRVDLRLSHRDYVADETYLAWSGPLDQLRNLTAVSVMKKGVSVRGSVLDSEGKPIAQAHLALGQNKFGLHAPETNTDTSGRFELAHCTPRQQAALTVTARDHAPQMKEIPLAKDLDNVEVRLAPARPLIVRTVDSQGRPLADTSVFLYGWRGLFSLSFQGNTDANGRVAWNEAPTDAANYQIRHAGYLLLMPHPLTGTGKEQTITLLPELKISGTVVDDESGKPIEKFRVTNGWLASPGSAPNWRSGFSQRQLNQPPPQNGKFELTEDLIRAGYVIRVEADGYLPAESEVLKPGPTNAALSFRLKKASDISATLVGADGTPLAGADVFVATTGSRIAIASGQPDRQTVAARTKSDEQGRVRLTPQAGNYKLLVVHDRAYGLLDPPQQPLQTMMVPQWGKVEGIAKVGAKPAEGQTVVIEPVKERQIGLGMALGERPAAAPPSQTGAVYVRDEVVADSNGHFVLTHVPPGDDAVGLRIKLNQRDRLMRYGLTQAMPVTVEAGKTASVSLGGLGRPVIGKLISDASLISKVDWYYGYYAVWTAHSNPGEFRRYFPLKVEADGSFRVEDIPAGTYEFKARILQPPTGSIAGNKAMATAAKEFTVADMPGGRSEQPLDIGTISLSAVDQSAPQPTGAARPATQPSGRSDGANASIPPVNAPFNVGIFSRLSEAQKLEFALQALEAREQSLENFSCRVRLKGTGEEPEGLEFDFRHRGILQWMHFYLARDHSDEVHAWDGQVIRDLTTSRLDKRYTLCFIADLRPLGFDKCDIDNVMSLHQELDHRYVAVSAWLRQLLGKKLEAKATLNTGLIHLWVHELNDPIQRDFWLNPQHGFMVDKNEMRIEAPEGSLSWHTQVTDVRTVSDVWVPAQTTREHREHWTQSPGNSNQEKYTYEIRDFQIGGVREQDARLEFPKDASHYIDMIRNIHYNRLPNGMYDVQGQFIPEGADAPPATRP